MKNVGRPDYAADARHRAEIAWRRLVAAGKLCGVVIAGNLAIAGVWWTLIG